MPGWLVPCFSLSSNHWTGVDLLYLPIFTYLAQHLFSKILFIMLRMLTFIFPLSLIFPPSHLLYSVLSLFSLPLPPQECIKRRKIAFFIEQMARIQSKHTQSAIEKQYQFKMAKEDAIFKELLKNTSCKCCVTINRM